MSSASNTFSAEVSDIDLSDQEYEVFLSFRGPDTRAGFTDHLYRRLIDANIRVYRDDEELRKGEEIGPELLQAINKSAIAIPIFSKRYAESKWCLKELVEIDNCRRSKEMKVMPIFYYVTPSEVRNQIGSFEEAFVLHEQNCSDNTVVGKWKEALREIGSLSGWEIPSNTYSREGELVEDVTKQMLFVLKKAYLEIPDCLVGLGCHVQRIIEMLSLEAPGVRIIGIHGMGGIGKTTLAKYVHNHLISKFECSNFLTDARSKDIEDLKSNLRSNILARKSSNYVDKGEVAKRFIDKKVLIVIDDVDEKTRIEDLIGKHAKQDWFASGSRIILTTRNKFLRQVQVDESYELKEMNRFHSLQLFCRHAFDSDNPKEDYAILSKQIVETTGGLPLALEVIGSSLRNNKSKANWEEKLEKLRKVPDRDVSKQLRISYEELDERQKIIFLDIACFFIGKDIGTVIHFWDPDQFYPKEALDVLQQKSLIKIEGNRLRMYNQLRLGKHDQLMLRMHDQLRLQMHDQLRDLGREIVCEGNIMKPEEQTRLWNPTEATKVFMTKKEMKKVQGICVEHNEKSHPYFKEEGLAKLSEVRLFWVQSLWDFCDQDHDCLSSAASYVFSEVRWLAWPRFPHKHIKTSYFSLLNLTILNLSFSKFTNDWDGWGQIKMAKNLKVIDLSGCTNLVRTPDFSSHLQLERLILKECSNLVEIDESIGMLEHLVHLNLSCCCRLQKLPKKLRCMGSLTELLIDESGVVEIPHWHSMVKLEVFSANGCSQLKNCISLNNLTSLKKLFLRGTQITFIPDSIGDLVHLEELDLAGCGSLKKLPESIRGLVSLTFLDISISAIEELPNSIGNLKSLIELRMNDTPVRELPSTIGMARKLKKIYAGHCRSLHVDLHMLPESLIRLSLPLGIMDADRVPNLSNLKNLVHFTVDVYSSARRWENERAPKRWAPIESPSPWWIGRLSKVEELDLALPKITTLHPDLSALSLLTHLRFIGCVHLQSILNLPSNLTSLEILCCVSLDKLEGLHNLESLTHLHLRSCMIPKIDELPENLISLKIENCQKLQRLPQMSQYKKLKEFDLKECHSLVRIHGRLEALASLSIEECMSLEKIPDVLNVKTLSVFIIASCPKLCHQRYMVNTGPILTDKSPESESKRLSTMLKICGLSQSTSCLGKRKAKEKGRKQRKWVET